MSEQVEVRLVLTSTVPGNDKPYFRGVLDYQTLGDEEFVILQKAISDAMIGLGVAKYKVDFPK